MTRFLIALALLGGLSQGAAAQTLNVAGCDGRLSLSNPVSETDPNLAKFNVHVGNLTAERVLVRFNAPTHAGGPVALRYYIVEPNAAKVVQLGSIFATGDKTQVIAQFWARFHAVCPPARLTPYMLPEALPLP